MDAKNNDELQRIVRANSPKGELRVNCTFNHRQLGFTDEWLKRAIEEANAKGEDADRDFGNVWTSGSQVSPLSVQLLARIRDSQRLDPHIQLTGNHGYATRWFVDENQVEHVMRNEFHIMSIDSSDAVGLDDMAMSLRNVKTGGITGAGTFNETNIITFCEWLVEWFVKYEHFVLIIERRSTGASILDYLLLMLPTRNIDPFKRIYNRCVQDAEEFPDRYKEISKPMYSRGNDIYVKYKKMFGWATSGTGATSRSELYGNTFQQIAKLTADKVHDVKTINQILSLIIRNGRVDHPPGGNDDHVVSWLLSGWLLIQGRNLHHYGINSKMVLIDNKVNQEINNPVVLYNSARQNHYRNLIEVLVDELKRERDTFIVQRLEQKIRSISMDLTEEDRKILSVDDLLLKLRDDRSKRHLVQSR